MKALQNYSAEIQSANAIFTGFAPQDFRFNGMADYASYRAKLYNLEFQLLEEYAHPLLDDFQLLHHKACIHYLTDSKNCFRSGEGGELLHRHYHFASPIFLETAPDLHQQARLRAQDFIRLQFDSITRINSLLVDEKSAGVSPCYWTGKQIQLLEIGHAFLVCGYILPVDPGSSKHEWFNAWYRFLRQPPPAHLDQYLYKMANRDFPSRFLSEFLARYQEIMRTYA